MLGDGYFDGHEIQATNNSRGRCDKTEFYYGVFVGMNNSGRGHVISYDGIHINYWRTPLEEGGEVKVDNRFAYELLSSYGYEPFF